jgi:hypothetical protein
MPGSRFPVQAYQSTTAAIINRFGTVRREIGLFDGNLFISLYN